MSPVEPNSKPNPDDERVVVLAPTGRDAKLACGVLANAAMPAHACNNTHRELRTELRARPPGSLC